MKHHKPSHRRRVTRRKDERLAARAILERGGPVFIHVTQVYARKVLAEALDADVTVERMIASEER